MLKGVISVSSGYAGGKTKNPTYEEVSLGNTGHAEVIRIEYDPSLVSYKTLLTVFFGSHDPTTLNRQGADVGSQYRSVIFYSTDDQKKESEDFIKDINNSNLSGSPIITEISPLEVFYPAEDYHQNYYENNKQAGYCQIVINPKLEKVKKEFARLLNNQ